MTVKTKPEERLSRAEFVEGDKALRNFTDTMKGLFRVRKEEIQDLQKPPRRTKNKKAGS